MTVGVAVVGYGYWGVNRTRNVAAAGTTELVGVVDPSADRRDLAAANLGGITTWESLDDALRDQRVEAVVIATPASTHVDLAVQAVRNNDQVAAQEVIALKGEVDRGVQAALAHQSEMLGREDPKRLVTFRLEMELVENIKRIHTLAKRIARGVLPQELASRVE